MINPFESISERLGNIETLLLDLKHNPKSNLEDAHSSSAWLNLNELCEYIPDKPAKATVYSWVHTGVIPYHKGGKRLRFLKSDIDTWLKSGRNKTNAEISADADAYVNSKKK